MDHREKIHRLDILPSTIWGVAGGVIYAVVMRLIFGIEGASKFLDTISTAFLFIMPSAMGAITVIVARKDPGLKWHHHIFLPWISVFAAMTTMMLLLLEGSICIVMATPIFMVAASVGGLLAGFISDRIRRTRGILGVLFVLPFAVSPIDTPLGNGRAVREVSTSIEINSSASEVWGNIISVKDIKEREVPFSFTHVIGVPKPVSADMSGFGVGAKRISRWGKGIYFGERITKWNVEQSLAYEFEVYPDSIPRDALDNHVEINGRYFDLVDGRYELTVLDVNRARLTLVTRYRNKSSMNWYGNLWGDFLFDDFHQSILGLIKHRSEQIAVR